MLVRSAILIAMSGSVGGITAAKNRGGQYMRARTIPTNPQTSAQSEVRLNLAAVSTNWRAINESKRDSWNSYATQFAGNNAVGGTTTPSGMNEFVGVNTLRLLGGLAQLEDPPTEPGRATFTPSNTPPAYSVGGAELSVDFATADDWNGANGGRMFVYVGKPVSAGVSYYKGPYQLAATAVRGASALTSPFTSGATLPLGTPSVTQKLFCKIVTLTADGRRSTPYFTQIDVTA